MEEFFTLDNFSTRDKLFSQINGKCNGYEQLVLGLFVIHFSL